MDFFLKLRKKFSLFFDRQVINLRKFEKQHHLDRLLVVSLNRSRKIGLKQLKYLPKFLSPKEKRQVNILLVVIISSTIFLIIQGLLSLTSLKPGFGGEYVEGVVGAPLFINPILASPNSVDGDLSKLVFSSLIQYDENHNLVPDLAESFEISEDQLVYTFHLRQDVKWHDGEPFKADDVIFTFSSIQDSQFKSPLNRRFQGMRAEKVDDYTVKFILKEPFAPFLSMLTFGILPEHLWYNIPPNNADLNELNKKPIGTGPWKFDNLKKDKLGNIKSYTLSVFDGYYGKKPYLSKITFKFYADNNSAIEALKNQNVDGIGFLPLENKDELKKHKNIILNQLQQPQYAAIFFNQKNNALLQADYIRQALALSLDKNKIVNEVFGDSARVIDAPLLSEFSDSLQINKYNYDPEAAATLLKKNGWELISTTTENGLTEQFRVKKNWNLEIKLTLPDQLQYVEVAKRIKESWNQIGVKVNLEIVDKSKIIQENINGRKYEALLFSYNNFLYDPDPFAFWHSSQNEYPGSNLAVFSNKKLDDLLESARKNNDINYRREKYSEFQKIVSTELPAIFLYTPYYIYPQNKIIKGFKVAAVSRYSDRFSNLSDWYIKVKRSFDIRKIFK